MSFEYFFEIKSERQNVSFWELEFMSDKWTRLCLFVFFQKHLSAYKEEIFRL